jgi:hypothetical protein
VHELIYYIADATTPSGGINSAYLITAILAAVVVVCGGLFGLIRVIWRTANIMRDMTLAVKDLTKRFNDFIISVDGRFDKLSTRVLELEQREFGRHDGLFQPGSPGESAREYHRGEGS